MPGSTIDLPQPNRSCSVTIAWPISQYSEISSRLTERAAVRRAAAGETPHAAIAALGQGWIAEEALAIAVYCALAADSLEEGVVAAVNITGDSDSTGAMTGNLLGALHGDAAIPERWLAPLELRDVITTIAEDLVLMPQADWHGCNTQFLTRYPVAA